MAGKIDFSLFTFSLFTFSHQFVTRTNCFVAAGRRRKNIKKQIKIEKNRNLINLPNLSNLPRSGVVEKNYADKSAD
jgi:hypothetical protein